MHSPFDDRPEPASERAYVVYDGERGTVVHLHRVLAYAGADETTVEQDRAQALEVARRVGHDTRDLRALHVQPADLEASARQRVDLETLRLVSDPANES
ncbi:hypothetical protein ACZ90_70250 [Streptomyces albus subsp. albus]|nr:hypothetical protein ACZ90_70250 [Streptomyces albus subsp. albus]